MAELRFPNMLAALNEGMDRGRTRRFNALAGQAYGAPAEGRNALLQQAVGIDAQAGVALDDKLQDRDDGMMRRAYGAARYVKQAIDTKNPQAVQGAYAAVRPFLARLGAAQGKVPPEQWSDEMIPAIHQILAQGGGGESGNSVQSRFIGEDGQVYALMRDGGVRPLGIKADPNVQVVEGDGGFYRVDKRGGSAAPVQLGGAPAAQSAAVQPSGPVMSQVSYATDDGSAIPPEEQQFAQQAFAAASRGEQFDVPVGGALPQTRAPASMQGQLQGKGPDQAELRRLQIAEEANERAAEAARMAAYQRTLGNAPAGFRFKADGTLEAIPGGPKPAGAAASEDERKAAAWLAQAENSYRNMASILQSDDAADDPGFIESYVPWDEVANRSRSDTRQRYVQAASSLSEALLRAATGAGITRDEATQKVRELTPQRGDSNAVKQQKLAAIPVYIAALRQRAGRAAPGAQPNQAPQQAQQAQQAAAPRARNPQTGQVVEFRNGQWVPAQ